MRVLVLGGTVFLGRHVAQAFLAARHHVTLFNRGVSGPDLFPGVERLAGDRLGDLGLLGGRDWDAVVDTSGKLPWAVRACALALRGRCGLYIFVSTVSVYQHWGRPGPEEAAPTVDPVDDRGRALDLEAYGGLKLACERALQECFGGAALVVRPGLLAGPFDPTDRFTYWPARLARGGEVLAPGRPERRVQVLDARDLAAWLVRMAEARRAGLMNACGPGLAMERVLEACREASRAACLMRWVDEGFLERMRVEPWSELPLWIPGVDDAFDSDASRRAGLECRSLEETARDTLSWDAGRPPGDRRAGLSPERERMLLEAWKAWAAPPRGAAA